MLNDGMKNHCKFGLTSSHKSSILIANENGIIKALMSTRMFEMIKITNHYFVSKSQN